jgi:hypothetical protein
MYIALILKRLSDKETLQSVADAFELTISRVKQIQEACFTNGQAVDRFINVSKVYDGKKVFGKNL